MTHINTHGGGAATNRNGLAFEQATETHEAMRTAGINLVQLPKRGSKLLGHEVFDKFHHRVGLQLQAYLGLGYQWYIFFVCNERNHCLYQDIYQCFYVVSSVYVCKRIVFFWCGWAPVFERSL